MPGGSICPSSPTSRRPVPVSGQGEPAGATGSSRLANELSPDDVPHNISRSRVRSATIFLSLLFSPSSAFSRRISSGSSPPYRVCRVNSPPDCSLILLTPVEVGRLADPCLAANLGHRRAFLALPQDERLSRASVNLDAFIILSSSPSQGRLAENSSFKRSSFQGAEQAAASDWGRPSP